MISTHERLSAQFYNWEIRGRGWTVLDGPVALEPPFRPFYGHYLSAIEPADTTKRDSLLGGIWNRLHSALESAPEEPESDLEEEPGVKAWQRGSEAVEIQFSFPEGEEIQREAMAAWLVHASLATEPLAFEVVASPSETVVQVAASNSDALHIAKAARAFFPDVKLDAEVRQLVNLLEETPGRLAIAEFGLEREFMVPLHAKGADWYEGLLGVLGQIEDGELALLQVLFHPVRHAWGESALRAVTDNEDGPFFVNRPELVPQTVQKTSLPLYAVVLRFAAKAETEQQAWGLIARMAVGLEHLSAPGSNRLVPLDDSDYDPRAHLWDLLNRQSRRMGMLLNRDELLALAHMPDCREPVIGLRMVANDGAPPHSVPGSLSLGEHVTARNRSPVTLTPEQRVRHLHLMGASGSGKSTLILNMIRQDLESGQGISVLDPHGDLATAVLGMVPEHRIKNVVVLDPSDEEWSVGFNIFSAQGSLEKSTLASDLISIFKRLSTSWGDQMTSVLQYSVLAFLESSRGGTLADLQRFLLDQSFRTEFLKTVDDPDIVFFWQRGFPQLGGNKSVGPILTRLSAFLAPKPIRYMVAQRENRVDLAHIMNSGKILVAKLPQGLLGRENSALLGSLLVAKFQQGAMSRQRIPELDRAPHYVYIDEFQNFITPSMAEILSGARKYGQVLVLAHQDLAQLNQDASVSSAVLSNSYTRVTFRLSDADARSTASGFTHFEPADFQNLGIGQAICRIEKADQDFRLTIPRFDAGDAARAEERRNAVIEHSRQAFARPRAEIEAHLRGQYSTAPDPPPKSARKESPSPVEQPTPEAESAPQKNDQSADTNPIDPPVGEPESVELPPESKAATSEPQPRKSTEDEIASLGKGGELHKAAQLELKQVAEGHGFRATIEKQLPGSQQSVDLYLEREGFALACEISVTNTLAYEARNVLKAHNAGMRVAVIALESGKLEKLRAVISDSITPDQAQHVSFFLKSAFIEHIQKAAMARPIPPSSREKSRKGWNVRTSVVQVDETEARQREHDAALAFAKRKSRPDPQA